MGRSRGLVTSHVAVGVDRNDTSSAHMAGEASAHVQSFGLKVVAVVYVRLTNSPVTRGQPPVTVPPWFGGVQGMQDYNFSLILQYAMVAINVVPLLISLAIVIAMGIAAYVKGNRKRREPSDEG